MKDFFSDKINVIVTVLIALLVALALLPSNIGQEPKPREFRFYEHPAITTATEHQRTDSLGYKSPFDYNGYRAQHIYQADSVSSPRQSPELPSNGLPPSSSK